MTEHQFNNEIIDEEQLSNKYSSDHIISHSQLKNEAAYYWARALSK